MTSTTSRHLRLALAAAVAAAAAGFWVGHFLVGFAPPPPVEAAVVSAAPAPGHVTASLVTPHDVIDGVALPEGTQVDDVVRGWAVDGSFSTSAPRTGPLSLGLVFGALTALVGSLLAVGRAEWSLQPATR